MALDVDGVRIQGARPYQEDTFSIAPFSRPPDDSDELTEALLMLADGMGGEGGGGTASTEVIDAFFANFTSTTSSSVSKRLETAVQAANEALGKLKEKDDRLPARAGTTFVGATVTDAGLEWVSVGDSLLLLFRDNQLKRLNADHSGAAILRMEYEAGRLTREQFETNPLRHRLMSAIIGDEIADIDVSDAPVPLKPDDLVIIASDGVETLPDSDLSEILSAAGDRPCRDINDAVMAEINARRRSNQDNATIITLRPDRPMGRTAKPGLMQKLNEPVDDHDWKKLAAIVAIIFIVGIAIGKYFNG